MEALTSRAAALPKIDLAPPRALIGKSTVDAIRSGVVYGFAARSTGSSAGCATSSGEETETIATGGLAGAIVPFTRDDRRGRRPAHAEWPAPAGSATAERGYPLSSARL